MTMFEAFILGLIAGFLGALTYKLLSYGRSKP